MRNKEEKIKKGFVSRLMDHFDKKLKKKSEECCCCKCYEDKNAKDKKC